MYTNPNMAQPFSLLSAIVGAADGLKVPDAWRDALLRNHLNAVDRAAVAQTYSGTLSWLLEDWRIPQLRVPVRGGETALVLLKRARAARRQLTKQAQCQPKPVTLAFVQQQGEVPTGDPLWWQISFAALSDVERDLPDLTLSLQLRHVSADLLTYAGQALGLLSTLVLGADSIRAGCSMQLPPPAALPALRHLTLHSVSADSQDSVWVSVRAYVPQLANLRIGRQPHSQYVVHADVATANVPQWCLALSHTASHTLTSLQVPCALERWLVKLLQTNAPALRELTVTSLPDTRERQGSTVAVAPVCSWGKLTLTESWEYQVSEIDWLPLPAEGRLRIVLPGHQICIWLPAAVSSKLSRVDLTFTSCDTPKQRPTVTLHTQHIPAPNQPAALRTALPHITHWQLGGQVVLTVHGVTMSDALVAELHTAQALGWQDIDLSWLRWPLGCVTAQLPRLRRIELFTDLTDEVLSELLQRVSWADELFASLPDLTEPLPAGTVLPWRVMRAGVLCIMDATCSIGAWLEQAQLVGGDVGWVISGMELSCSSEEDLVQFKRWVTELGTVRIVGIKGSVDLFGPDNVPPSDQPQLLRAGLALFNALQAEPERCAVFDYTATPEVLVELRNLPRWRTWLQFKFESSPESTGPDWPLSRLPSVIPSSYNQWDLFTRDLKTEEVDSFLRNAPCERTVLNPLVIKIMPSDEQRPWVRALCEELQASAHVLYPHVTFSVFEST